MDDPRDEHRRLDSSNNHTKKGLHQVHAGNIVEVLERISEAFFAIDCEWRFTYVNRHAAKLWGRSNGEVLGKNIWEEFPQAVGSEPYQQIIRAMEEGVNTEFEAVSFVLGTWVTGRAYPSPDGLSVYFQDITERKRAEKKLRQSEERFRAQYESIPVPTFSWQRVQDDFELVGCNRAADKITRGRSADLMGIKASQWYSDNAHILQMLWRCFEEGITLQDEISWRMRTTGEHKHFVITFAYVPPDLVMHHAEDITERKRAEKRLQEEERKYRAIFEHAVEGIFQTNLDGRMLTANPALARIAGYKSPEEFIANVYDVGRQIYANPEDRVEFISRVRRHGVVTDYEHQARRKDGSLRWVSSSARAMRDTDGNLFGFEGLVVDITERKQAQEALRQAKERFHSLVQYSSDSITVLAADGTILYESPAVERVLGYPPQELVGKNVFDYIHPHDLERVSVVFAQVLDDSRVHPSVEYRFLHANGSWRYLDSISSNQLRNPSVEGVVVNSRDVTERKRIEENQQQFLANAAHQLKTPITTIAGAAELLITKQNLNSGKRRHLLEHIFNEGRHMQRLSDTLLRLARVGWDQREPSCEVVDLAAAGRQAAERMIPLAESADLALRVEGAGTRVLADAEWLQEVLLILLSNAVKYSKPGQKVTMRLLEGAIAVEDEGAGVSSVDEPYIFERFYKGKGSREGFGLGLSICRDLVERMGGRVTLSSGEGVGTRVKVELPEAAVGA